MKCSQLSSFHGFFEASHASLVPHTRSRDLFSVMKLFRCFLCPAVRFKDINRKQFSLERQAIEMLSLNEIGRVVCHTLTPHPIDWKLFCCRHFPAIQFNFHSNNFFSLSLFHISCHFNPPQPSERLPKWSLNASKIRRYVQDVLPIRERRRVLRSRLQNIRHG